MPALVCFKKRFFFFDCRLGSVAWNYIRLDLATRVDLNASKRLGKLLLASWTQLTCRSWRPTDLQTWSESAGSWHGDTSGTDVRHKTGAGWCSVCLYESMSVYVHTHTHTLCVLRSVWEREKNGGGLRRLAASLGEEWNRRSVFLSLSFLTAISLRAFLAVHFRSEYEEKKKTTREEEVTKYK